MNNKGILSDKCILEYLGCNEIIIYPFNLKYLNTSSYDVTLGENYYKNNNIDCIYNIYSEIDVNKIWGNPLMAITHQEYIDMGNQQLVNIELDEKIIMLDPGEMILTHTNEYIGGVNKVTSMMKCRSSFGRSFINVCSCAGWGDIGYFNRWTMEIKNNSKYFKIPLIVNRPIAQIVFIDTEGIIHKSYNITGK